MNIQWMAGMALATLAGVMQGAFAFPMKFTRKWTWKNIWLASSFFSLVIIPWLIALYTIPLVSVVLASCPSRTIVEVFLFGAGWGIGGMLFGLGVHRVGLSLTLAVVIGLTSIVGCLVPLALFHSERLWF
jgi:L-rhamnose-H+ transport protein